MIVLVGQVDSGSVDREAFQEIDYRRMFGSVAKWAAQIDRAERIPEYLSRAPSMTAMSGRPGPGRAGTAGGRARDARGRGRPAMRIARGIHTVRSRRASGLRASRERRPPAGRLVGGSRWDIDASASLTAFAARHDLPVACGFRRQDLFDNRHPSYVGDVGIAVNPALATRIRDADVLLVIGERLGEMTTSGYTLVVGAAADAGADPRPPRRRRARPRVPACGRDRRHPRGVPRSNREVPPRSPAERWRASTAAAHADFEAWRAPRSRCPATWISGRSYRWLGRAASRRRDPRQRCRQLHDVAAPCVPLSPTGDATRAVLEARWATAFPPPWPRSSCIRRASSSRGTATAVS